jgi:hypothetical protein
MKDVNTMSDHMSNESQALYIQGQHSYAFAASFSAPYFFSSGDSQRACTEGKRAAPLSLIFFHFHILPISAKKY